MNHSDIIQNGSFYPKNHDCDHFWSVLPGLRHAWCGGVCFDETDCGMSLLNLAQSPEDAGWAVGA